MTEGEAFHFHPATWAWFQERYGTPTPAQRDAWPAIHQGRPVLVAAPTGSGKTLAAFLSAIDGLMQQGLEGPLPDRTQVLYVSPLKALSSDIAKNLVEPLAGISAALRARGLAPPEVRTAVRTGDTTAYERAQATKRPPHIQVTTPESLYILLTSEGGRRQLANVRVVIIDEIHAVLRDKRGAHLALSLERLDALVAQQGGRPVQRIGLSATQKPIEEVARYLLGTKASPSCAIVDSGHRRALDLSLWVPDSPLEPVLSNEAWHEIYDQLAQLTRAHKTTLIFTNTRRQSERVTRFLAERIGNDVVTSHHGSLSRQLRQDAETRLKAGQLRALVATASLELGIDVGDVDLVCQLGSPGSIATFLQRVGRSGHFVRGTPKGRLFPLSRDDLVECTALLDATSRGELDEVRLREAPLDILAQQIVASLVPEDLLEDDLYERVRGAYPYRNLSRSSFDRVVEMLTEGFTTARGRRAAYVHHDTVGKRLKARRGARMAAITNGGAIPDNFDYDVLLAPTDVRVGSLHEDFAIESSAGDIFQLGNQSYQILKVGAGVVRVADAHGAPPTIPFWIGEAPARTPELSLSVSRLRIWVDQHGDESGSATELAERLCIPLAAAAQVVEYLVATRNALGVMPTQQTLVAERFFDETSGMHVVIHAPFGSRFNRAFGLALRKRFCRSFNVELQAAADEDALVLSLGPMHSFPLEAVFSFLDQKTAEEVLIQALLDAPLFGTRWRWNASRALAVPRFRGGRKVPPRFQRMESDDLLALCFPDQAACLENIVGEREIPNHPLVQQTIDDSLREAMDVDRLLEVLGDIEAGRILCVARDLTEPSPLAHEILGAKPYAFLDDAPLEERRTQAVQLRRLNTAKTASDLGQLDPAAVAQVIVEAHPDPRDPDELHDALVIHGFLTELEGRKLEAEAGVALLEPLLRSGRATRASVISANGAAATLWLARERAGELREIHSEARFEPEFELGVLRELPSPGLELWRGRLEMAGPISAAELANVAAVSLPVAQAGLNALESEGFVLRGSFRPDGKEEFCERRLLARIHRLTLGRLRREIEPVSPATFVDFLTRFQGLTNDTLRRGSEGTFAVVEQLAGFAVAAGAWEKSVLPARIQHYQAAWLDELCLGGRVVWSGVPRATSRPVKSTPTLLMPREGSELWLGGATRTTSELGADAARLAEVLRARGASFFSELQRPSGLLASQAENALRELVSRGLCTTDSFAGLRTLVTPADKRNDVNRGPRVRRSPRGAIGMNLAGRVSWLGQAETEPARSAEDEQAGLRGVAFALLRRWGVVFRKLLERETDLPSWRDLLRIFYRLESRGEIRGGRFVTGFSGEQFALPDAVALLRTVRRNGPSQEPIRVSGVDPLNLVGILTPDAKLPATSNNSLLWIGGVAAAVVESGTARVLSVPDAWTEHALLEELRKPGVSDRASHPRERSSPLSLPSGPRAPGPLESLRR